MFISREDYNELVRKASEYEKLLEEAQKTINDKHILQDKKNQLEEKYNKLKEEKYKQISECNFSVNFKKLKAVSIERLIHEDREITNIGYLCEVSNEIKEWMFFCSRETHQRLVIEFNEQLNS